MKKLCFFLLIPMMVFSAAKKKNYHLKDTKIVNPVIMIDAGHGGADKGACVKNPYCKEKRLSLQTALLVEKHLKQLGYKVIMTRKTDCFVSLDKRVAMANRLSCDLFVSIHYNSCPTTAPNGIEIHFTDDSKNKKKSQASKKLAQNILDRLIHRTKAKNRGLKTGKLYVTKNTEMPSILVEGGFITNLDERKKIRQYQYRDKIAMGIAEGIDRFLKK
jgi:N-acetylmuramoyl-L-alanine amidase